MVKISYYNTIWYLLATDFKIFKRTIVDKLIDLVIWIVTMVLVTAYLMPSFGLSTEYTLFMVASLVASAGLFEVSAGVIGLISGFEGNNITSFYLTLPVPSWMIFFRSILFYAFNTAALGILVLPITKILLWHKVNLSTLSLLKLFIIFVETNFFYATLTLWTASKVRSIVKVRSIWMRFIYPLWFLGGFQYSWSVLYKFSPMLAYVSFINPMLYVMEGTRNAIMGSEGSLNFALCASMLLLFTVLCGFRGIAALKKRLDFL